MRLCLCISVLLSSCDGYSNGLQIVENGRSNYYIIVPDAAGGEERKAAQELQKYIYKVSGATLPIARESERVGEQEILVGVSFKKRTVNTGGLSSEGIFMSVTARRLILSGGSGKGVLYCVYAFLDQYVGCKKYTKDVTFVPSQKNITIPPMHKQQNPAFAFRSSYYIDAQDSSFANWHGMNHFFEGWGTYAHTFKALVPPELYFDTHPEYFALIHEKRNPGQLCLSQPKVLAIAIATLEKEIKRRPDMKVWSVSQNDNIFYCTCDLCQNAHERDGLMGTLMPFVNKIARRFPNKTISTLAYNQSLQPAAGLKPEKNVLIVFCVTAVNRAEPIELDKSSATSRFKEALNKWRSLTTNIFIWDYIVQYSNSLSPYPNLQTLKPNLLYFKKNNVKMLFEQGIGPQPGEFSELKAYLVAKLQWDPNQDDRRIRTEFMEGYYGREAGRLLMEYQDALEAALRRYGGQLDMYGNPAEGKDSYLSETNIKAYRALFEKAEKAVMGNTELRRRVVKERLCLDYAELEIVRQIRKKSGGLLSGGTSRQRPADSQKRLQKFVEDCSFAGITVLREGSIRPREYLSGYDSRDF